MKPFLDKLEHGRIEKAIAAAERKTSGEFRVVIHPGATEDPVALAKAEFAQLEMHHTRNRNAILILVAPASHTFAIYGDRGVHERCGERFWTEVAAAMSEHFKKGAFTEGIIHAVERAGALLTEHFPRTKDDRNELPDTVVDRGIVI